MKESAYHFNKRRFPRPRQAIRAAMALLLPRRLFLVNNPPAGRTVYLTFDDGPDPVHTPRLLDVLRRLGVTATFFVVGGNAERYPGILRRIVDEGHAVGDHSYYHMKPKHTSARQLAGELRRTADLFGHVLGCKPRLFRPPYGDLSPAKMAAAWAAGRTVVLWDADPKDFASESSDEIRRWFRCHPPAAGSVILMHDTCPHAADVLPDLVASARVRGLTFSKLAARPGSG